MRQNISGAPLRQLLAGVTLGALALLFAQALTDFGGAWADVAIDDGVYFALELGGAIACLVRAALVRDRRPAWICIGLGILVYAVGDAVWGLAYERGRMPWAANVSYILFYPLSLAGMALLLADGRDRVAARLWVDGLIGGLAVGAYALAFAYEPVLSANTGSAQEALYLGFPLADLLLIGFVLTAFATQAWRPGGVWVLLGAGMTVFFAADMLYAYQSARGSFDDDSIVSALWPWALVTWGWAAWQPWRPRELESGFGSQAFAIPSAFAGLSIVLLCFGQFNDLPTAAVVLATCALLVATARAGWTFREYTRLLRTTRREALTDGLTGLANRRALMADLDRAVALCRADRRRRQTLAFFDLDGFKGYNDGFGHAAGDMLLDRLAGRLAQVVAGHGRAYRLGGDEFCILLGHAAGPESEVVRAATEALREQGEGFDVGASCGLVEIPTEADSATHALQLADQRMYAAKDDSRQSSRRQTRDVLLQVLREREPDLHDHLEGVAALVVGVARRLGLSAEQVDEVARAAELHDIGKIAIPDAILHKPGPLDADEWRLMHEHTVIGDRILGAAPAMRPVAAIVRSSHERWDGSGYPDGLRGEQIPLGARIVAVCDAYDAMVSERPYQGSQPHADALAELRRCAGSQFDPRVVDAFAATIEALKAATPPARVAGGVERV